ncbi:cation:proton antiporter domain-containing protein [Chromohalobacter israelensis]|uniref:cation:proton antiporter domain-containing protein n=1 Tax=Chromohalobacter israelensis TaxID=141390 RepID=UPI000FFED3D8|nr:cation:proton antiporter [Chromohalobacter salexigens]RXE47892.1 sodium:proton exchanger [Chromohalobacter salexigens]
MAELNIAWALVGGIVLTVGMLSQPLDHSWASPPMLAFAVGALLGPQGLALLDPFHWGNAHVLMEETARLTLGISLMGIALRLPPRYPLSHWRSVMVLLAIGMPAMFLISGWLTHWVLGIPLLTALLIGACICATDPVLSSSIVTGGLAKNNLPGNFRHLLSTESGANDGLAYPLVLLPILLMTVPTSAAWTEWLFKVWAWEVGGAIGIGALLGWLAGRSLNWSETKGFLDQPSFLSLTLALTVLVLGVGKLIGTDSILAVFAAGLAFDQVVGGKERSEADNVQEAVNIFITLPVFVLFGLMAPWHEWLAFGWSGLGLIVLVLLLRRLPVILALRPLLPPVRGKRISWVMGWFGPIGVSALFYSVMAAERTGDDVIWHAGSLVVFASVIAHGMTAAPFAKVYGRLESRR